MRIPILILGATVALGACSTLASQDAPTCDGRHRRPANLYGSVLVPPPTSVVPEPADETPDADSPTEIPTPVMPAPASAPGGCA